MNHYIDTNNKIWGFDDTQADLVPVGAVSIPTTYTSDQYPYITLINGTINFNSTAYTAALQADKLAACKVQAQILLQATDWVTLSDVTTGNPKLTNQSDFLSYRSTVRALFITPVVSPIWPALPTAQWA
jgi:hypothetical protein